MPEQPAPPCSKRTPCKTCPWRRDAELGYWHDDHYREMADSCQRDGLHEMGCHYSTKENFRVCAGWVLVMGMNAVGVRLAMMNGKYTPEDFDAAGLELYDSWEEMAEANGVETKDMRPGMREDWGELSHEERRQALEEHCREVNERWERITQGLNERSDPDPEA